ncbi:hypothetical protein [Embleya hyalina]|nr:hypothetical protein [Embleya hyalina]
MTTLPISAHTQEAITAGNAFLARYRHAVCRNDETGQDGVLMDAVGTHLYLRDASGFEFDCYMEYLVVVSPPPPVSGAYVRYVGTDDSTRRSPGQLMEMWALRGGGAMATVQPPATGAWFALLSDLVWTNFPHPMGHVANWAELFCVEGEAS